MRHRHSGRPGVENAVTCILVCLPARPAVAAPVPAAARALGLGKLDLQRPAIHLMTVELLDRRLGLFGRRHLDEAEPARAIGALLHHDRRRLNPARLREHLAKTLARRRKGKTPDEQFVRHRAPPNVSPAMNEHALEQRKRAPETRSDEEGVHQRTNNRTRHDEYDTARPKPWLS